MYNVKIEIKWAFIFMVVFLLWMLLEKLTGLHSHNIHLHQYLTMVYVIPAVVVYVFALKDKKNSYYNGVLSYKQAFVSGLIISVIVSAFSPLTQWIVSYWISPEYFPNVIEYALKTGYFKTYEEAKANFNYKNYAFQSTLFALVMGIITTLIVAIFVKSKKPTG